MSLQSTFRRVHEHSVKMMLRLPTLGLAAKGGWHPSRLVCEQGGQTERQTGGFTELGGGKWDKDQG